MKNRTINVKGADIAIASRHEQDYISLTDMVKNFDGGSALIEQWLKNKDTVLFLGVWEQINNQDFNSLEFERIEKVQTPSAESGETVLSRKLLLWSHKTVKKSQNLNSEKVIPLEKASLL